MSTPDRGRLFELSRIDKDGYCTGCNHKVTRETGRCLCIGGPATRVISDTPRPPMTQSEPVLTAEQARVDLLWAWFNAHPNQPMPQGRRMVERRLRAIRAAAQSPVQPVLSGLEERITGYLSRLSATGASYDPEAVTLLRAVLAATAPAAHQHDPFMADRCEGCAALAAPAADEGPMAFFRRVEPLQKAYAEGYNAAISDAQQVLQDMPGISDNDGSQPRPEPDYIERAEAVAEVEKLRR